MGKHMYYSPFEDEDETKSPLDAIVRIGMIGHPNMGKSSLINALMGKKIVSVSKTPGHTKHLQTLFLSRHCMLVDGPGLVFPRIGTSPGILVTFGLIPIAQVLRWCHWYFSGQFYALGSLKTAEAVFCSH